MSNPKNQLQEFCQKNKLELPKYETTYVNGIKSGFRSKVTITWKCKISKFGNISKNKKFAELSAATFILDKIRQVHDSNIKRNYKFLGNNPVYIYIDMENIHIGDFFDHHEFPDVGYYFTGFSTYDHPSIRNVPSNMEIITLRSDHKDAADTLMIFHIGRTIDYCQGKTIIIVTKDHFAASLVEIINSNHGVGSKGYRCKSMDELDNVLDQFIVEK